MVTSIEIISVQYYEGMYRHHPVQCTITTMAIIYGPFHEDKYQDKEFTIGTELK